MKKETSEKMFKDDASSGSWEIGEDRLEKVWEKIRKSSSKKHNKIDKK